MGNGMEYMCVSYSEGVVCGSHVGTYSAHESISLHMCPPLLAPSLRSPLTSISSLAPRRVEEGWTQDWDQTQSRTSQLRVKQTGQSPLGACS